MRIVFLALALLLVAALPSRADSVTITLTAASGTCSGAGCTKTFTDSSNTLTSHLIADYGPPCQAQNLTGSPPAPTACTPIQVLTFWAQGLANGTVNYMATFERQAAAAAAAAAVNQITAQ